MTVDGGKWNPQTRRHIELVSFIEKAEVPKASKILDVGCGPGWLIGRLREKGFHNVYGCDWKEPLEPYDFRFERADLNNEGLKY